MRLTPPEPEIPESGGFTESNDLFGLRDFADRLANVIRNIDEPLVIVLDGPWGSGKSVFIKQWAGLLRKRGAPVIYFDAFANDHYEDPFLAISAEIYAAAKELLPAQETAKRRFLDRTKKVGVVLTPIATRVAARTLSAGLFSSEDFKEASDAVKAAAKAIAGEAEKAVERTVSERLREATEAQATLEAFRATLSELAGVLSRRQAMGTGLFPLVFIVDELDRCRPPYAVGAIERIKHLFSVPGVCFVLVTHLDELEHAVRGAYGVIDARMYLEKFYHLRAYLPQDRDQDASRPSAYVRYLWEVLGISCGDHDHIMRQQIEALAVGHGLPLRSIERIMTSVALLAAALTNDKRLFVATLGAPLCVMRQKNPQMYAKARSGMLRWDEAHSFFETNGPKILDEEGILWWKFATYGVMKGNEEDIVKRAIMRFHMNRQELLLYMASVVDGLVPTKSPS